MASAGGTDAEARVGATIAGKYFLHQLLGRGGMGEVYKATLLGAERPVALKLLASGAVADPDVARRFQREAAAASRLRHPNAIELVEIGAAADGSPYLAMEFVPGRTLAQVIAADAPLPAGRAVFLLAQVLAALADAHANGVIHRDLKPANVMIDPLRDAAGFVKVLDFGIATLAEGPDGDARLTARDVVFGTPAYMSPEQIRGEPLDARSDLYSAGVMLFEMLAGALPFEAPTPMAIAAKHLTEPAPRLSARRPGAAAPPALEALLARALAKDPAQRPASAEVMRSELVASLAALPEPARAPPRPELPPTEAFRRAAPRRRRSPARPRVLAAGAAVAGLAAVLLLGVREDPSAPASPVAEAPSPPVRSVAPAQPSAPAPVVTNFEPERRPTPPPRPPVARERIVARGAPAAPPPPPAIRLVRGELNSVPTPPAATGDGVLVLVATPWADVEVEGVPLGETPREVRLRAGTYGVRAVHPELGVRVDRVVVGAGERRLWAVRYEP